MENILGINFKLMCEQQHILARICREKIIRRKYLKGKEEKRRYKENQYQLYMVSNYKFVQKKKMK